MPLTPSALKISARRRCSNSGRLLAAAGRGVFARPGPERVRGDGQGLGAGGVSVNAPHRTVAVSWRGESRYWCCGCRAGCCCDSPTGSCAHRCSSCRRVSPGWCLLCPWPKNELVLIFVCGRLFIFRCRFIRQDNLISCSRPLPRGLVLAPLSEAYVHHLSKALCSPLYQTSLYP